MAEAKELDDALRILADELAAGPSDSEYEFWKAPDLLRDFKDGRFPLGQFIGEYAAEEFRAILTGLIGLFIRRQLGEERPKQQLNLVHKFVFPQKFEVPWTVIESLATKYESGHLIRGWALRRVMYELADLVELTRPELEDVTASHVVLSPRADQRHRLYPLARRYCNRKTTLQSLAVRVYLALIERENKHGVIDEPSLRRDLRRLKAWEDTDEVHTRLKKEYAATSAGHHWKARIPIRLYSESFRPLTPSELAEADRDPSPPAKKTKSGR